MPEFYDDETLARLQYLEMDILHDFVRICEENHLTWFGYAGTGIGALRHKGYIPWDDDIDISMPRKDYDEFMRIVTEQMSDKYHVLNSETDENYPLATTRLCLNGTVFREHSMKDVDCDWGIFLDLYALENAADNPIAFWFQMWSCWFWGKILILRSIPRPYLYVHGLLAKIVTCACVISHHILRILHIKKSWLIHLRESAGRRYENRETKRIAYFCDPRPDTNTFEVAKTYPLRYLPFEDFNMPFPNNLEELLTKMYGDYMTPPPVEKRKTHFPYELDFGPYKDIEIPKKGKKEN
ncbi:MAG: LicD family protein [Lachnospiraceae bacterium]|nr:LicD family protein [Lachnospiraceae bacterium]